MFKLFPQLIVIAAIAVILVIVLRRLSQVTIKEDALTPEGGTRYVPTRWLSRLGSLLSDFVSTLGTAVGKLFGFIKKPKIPAGLRPKARIRREAKFSLRTVTERISPRISGDEDAPERTFLGSADVNAEEQDFIKQIERDPTNHEAYEGLGKLYLDGKKYKDALEVYDYLAKLHSDNDVYFSKLGLAHFNLGNYDSAIEAYNTAITLKPDAPHRLVNLSLCYEAKGEFPEAVDAAERALHMDPDNVQYMVLLAEYLIVAGKKEDATELLEKALEVEPTNQIARHKLMELKF